MSAPVFYVLATLVVAAALGAVAAPTTRLALLGVLGTDVLVGILLIAAGALVLGAVVVLLPALCLFAVAALLRRSEHAPLFADIPVLTQRWPLVAGVSSGVGILLLWTATNASDDSAGAGGAGLITLLHYRFPISVGVAVLLAVVAVLGAVLIGRADPDERRLDEAAAQRRLREQRSLARRLHRADARTQRGGQKTSS